MTTTTLETTVVTAAAGGDISAFGRIVDAYRATVCSIALAIVGDVAASEDVAQDVFVAAWARLAELRDTQSLGPWLRQITRNRAHDALRRRPREPTVDPDDADRVAALQPDPAQTSLMTEEREAVTSALADLPTDAREILLLYYREGRSVRQVARLLDLSEVAAKKRLSRARAALRADVLARFGDAATATAPKAAFTTAVLVALTVGSPGVAGATAAGIVATGGKLGKLALGGAVAGPLISIAAIMMGMRRHIVRARSESERAALRRISAWSVAHVALLAIGMFLLGPYARHPVVLWSWYGLLMSGFALTHFIWIPRVIADRQAAERRDDPGATRRQRRQWWLGVAGWCVGAISGAAAVAWALAHAATG